MTENPTCSRCGAELSAAQRLRDLCPRCLLLLGLGAGSTDLETVEDFEILDEIGRGGMGVVYRALQPSLNRVVALKILSETLARDESFVQRFRNEATAAAQLNHPNVVAIHGVGQSGDRHYIAMEYVEGQSLTERIEAQGHLEVDEALRITRQVLQALAAAHTLDIIHRDIKSQNILVDEAGRVRVLDFGLAQLPPDVAAACTQPGSVMGTLASMAPEQCRGDAVDHRADLYAVGIVLYEMLTGRVPYQADSPAALIQAILSETPPDPRTFNAVIPDAVVRLIERALAKSTDDRFHSAEEMEEAIVRYLETSEFSGSRNGLTTDSFPKRAAGRYPGIAWRTRTRVAVAFGLVAGLLAIGAILAGSLKGWRSEGIPIDRHTGQTKLKARNIGVYDVLGHSVALDGDTILLGALRDDDFGVDSGTVGVFERKKDRWVETAILTADDAAAGQWFGYSVALDGDTAVVGAYKNSQNGRWAGAVYVFERDRKSWRQTARLTPRDASVGDWFGFDVALQGDTVVVGAIQSGGPDRPAGAVYVFQRTESEWRERVKFSNPDGEPNDQFGYRVAIDGDTIAVGAVEARKDPGQPRAGCVFVYRDTSAGGDWSRTAETRIAPADRLAGDRFGSGLALHGDLLVVGADNDAERGSGAGAAYVFRRSDSQWIEEAKLTAREGEADNRFGSSVAVDAERIFVGAQYDDFPNHDCGAVYLFASRGGQWTQTAVLHAGAPQVGDILGANIDLDGDWLLAGAECDDEMARDSGAAYLFDLRRLGSGRGESRPGP
jgi:hypothetical protein